MGPRKMIELSKIHRSEIDNNPILRKKQIKLLVSFVAFLIPFRLTMFSLDFHRNMKTNELNNVSVEENKVVDMDQDIKVNKVVLESNGLKGNTSVNLNKGTPGLGYGRFAEGENVVYYAKNNYVDSDYKIIAYDKAGSEKEVFKTNYAIQNILDFDDYFIFLSKTDDKPQSDFTKIIEYDKKSEDIKEVHSDPAGIGSLFTDGENFYYGNDRGLQYFNKNNKAVETIAYSNEDSPLRVVGLSEEQVFYIDGVSIIGLDLKSGNRTIIKNGKGKINEFSHIDENDLAVYFGYDLGVNTGIIVNPKQVEYILKNSNDDVLIPRLELETDLKGLYVLPMQVSEILNGKSLAFFDNYIYKMHEHKEGVVPIYKMYNEFVDDIYLSKDLNQYYVFSTSGELLDVVSVDEM